MSEQEKEKQDSKVMARRYFLKAAVYSAPVIAGVVKVNHASAQVSNLGNDCPALQDYCRNNFCTDPQCFWQPDCWTGC